MCSPGDRKELSPGREACMGRAASVVHALLAISCAHAEKRPAVFLMFLATKIVILFSAIEGGWVSPLKSTVAECGVTAITESVQQPVAAC